MVKRLFILLLSVSLIFLLVACDSSTYSRANSAYESEDYETAILLFEELGDYENSKEMLKKSLDGYISDLLYLREWDKATIYLEKYKSLVSETEYKSIYSETIEDFVAKFCVDEEWEKARILVDTYCDDYNVSYLYDQITYRHGIKLLEESKFDEGISQMSLIECDSTFYVSAQKVINDYNQLKSSALVQQFLGNWDMQTTSIGLVFKGTLYFELKYDKVVCTESCNQDGYVSSSEHNLYYDNFEEKGIKFGRKEWILNDDGTLSYGGYEYTKR